MQSNTGIRLLSVLPLALAATILAPTAHALELTEAELYFELNDTDGDLGLHSSIDGGPYTHLEIEGPGDRKLIDMRATGALARQGLTQLFFESAEPSFDELAPEIFFRRFPEGRYEITAETASGDEAEAVVRLSQVMASRVPNLTVNGIPSVDCDEATLPLVSGPVTINWGPVTHSHPTIGRRGPVQIARYEFFVERPGVKLGTTLPSTVTQFDVPQDIRMLGASRIKYEIIARTSTGNNTAVEACFNYQP